MVNIINDTDNVTELKKMSDTNEQNGFEIRDMQIEDFEQIHEMWMEIKGFSIRSVDDSFEGIKRFLKRNPNMSVAAFADHEVVGSILVGHDGRRGCFYHVCVKERYRNKGIASMMVKKALEKLELEQISKVSLVAFQENLIGNTFWTKEGWEKRIDLNSYEYTINLMNICTVNA